MIDEACECFGSARGHDGGDDDDERRRVHDHADRGVVQEEYEAEDLRVGSTSRAGQDEEGEHRHEQQHHSPGKRPQVVMIHGREGRLRGDYDGEN